MGKELPKCIRCGLCCLVCICDIGEEAEDGLCKYLSTDGDIANCSRISDEGVTSLLTGGCFIRLNKDLYEAHVKTYYNDRYEVLRARKK
jgi:hypothetical protein